MKHHEASYHTSLLIPHHVSLSWTAWTKVRASLTRMSNNFTEDVRKVGNKSSSGERALRIFAKNRMNTSVHFVPPSLTGRNHFKAALMDIQACEYCIETVQISTLNHVKNILQSSIYGHDFFSIVSIFHLILIFISNCQHSIERIKSIISESNR